MTVEDPLSRIVGVGLGETVGVFFVGDFGPVIEVERNFEQGGVGYIQFLIEFSYAANG